MSRSLLILVSLLSLVGCRGKTMPPSPGQGRLSREAAVAWDSDPTTVIVKLYSPHTTAGLAGAYDSRYYVPEVQVWGDGRIIWVQQEGQSRRVLEGQLTAQDVQALLERIVGAGFFEWEDSYSTLGGNSSPTMHLLVNLAVRSKEIREHGGAPEAYYLLKDYLLGGAGARGHDFAPTRAYLTATRFPAGAEAPEWPLGAVVTPESARQGRYVDGEVLAFVWALVNRNPTAPVYVRHKGAVYTIMVQVPEVSYFEPPSPASPTEVP